MFIIVDTDGNILTPYEYATEGDALVDAFAFPAGTFMIVPKES